VALTNGICNFDIISASVLNQYDQFKDMQEQLVVAILTLCITSGTKLLQRPAGLSLFTAA